MSPVWHQKSPRRPPKVTFSESFSAPWVIGGVIWPTRGIPNPIRKAFGKFIENSRFLGFPGDHTRRPPPTPPGSKKRTFSAKVAIPLQSGSNFQFLDFGTPLEKSVSLTFSEQLLCHCSKYSGGGFPVGVPGSRASTRHSRAHNTDTAQPAAIEKRKDQVAGCWL